MGDNFRFHIEIKLIEDLPTRPQNILDCMLNGIPLPDGTELPEHCFFTHENWKTLFTSGKDISDTPQYRLFKDGTLHANCTLPEDENDTFRCFLMWLHPYFYIPREVRTLGYVRYESIGNPTILTIDSNSMASFNLDKVLTADHPVVIDPEDKSIKRMPSAKDIGIMLKDILPRIIGEDAPVTVVDGDDGDTKN